MSDTADAHPEAGSIQGGERPSDESGMSVDDAATSAYDDADRAQNGIAEGEREGMGQWLKSHADHAGTTVHEGLQSLVQTAAVIRNGDQATKREMLGFLVDQYGVRGVPGVEEPAPQFDEFGDPVGRAPQQAIASEAAAMEGVHEFIRANPIVEDPAIHQSMLEVAAEMQRQGYAPHLPTMLEHAITSDPRYSEQARRAQEAEHLARAREGTGQVSGGGTVTPSAKSDDVGAILDELIPR